MSLFKKATTFISIFNEVRAKNEAQRQVSAGLDSSLKQAEQMRAEINGFNIKPKRTSKLENGYTTGYAGTGYYSNGVRVDDDREWYEH